MLLPRENGSHNNISFSLSLYLNSTTLYQKIQQLLQDQQVEHQAQELPKKQLPHHYYINIPLEHHSSIPWDSTLKQFIQQETTLVQPLYYKPISLVNMTTVAWKFQFPLLFLTCNRNCIVL